MGLKKILLLCSVKVGNSICRSDAILMDVVGLGAKSEGRFSM